MSKENRIASDTGLYTLMTLLTQAVTLIAGILTRRFLGPTQMGIWSLLQILTVVSAYSALGVTEAVSREIPFHLGRGEKDKAEEIKDLIYSFSSLTSGLIAVGCVAYALLMRTSLEPEFFWGLLLMSIVIWVQRASNLRIAFLRGYKLFAVASKQMFYSAIVNAILVAVLSYRFKVYGFIVAMILSFLFNLAYIRRYQKLSFRWTFDWPKIAGLIQYGFPLILVSMISVLSITIDKLMIAHWIGVRELGLYSVAILTYSFLVYVPNSVGIVLIPNFHQKFGETQNVQDLVDYVNKSSGAFIALMPALIVAGWFLVPYLIHAVLPEFRESIAPMQYLILSAFFIALAYPYSYFLVVIRKQSTLVPVYALTCVLGAAANWVAIRGGYGIAGVGVAASVVALIRFAATFALAHRHYPKAHPALREFAVVHGQFILMLGIIFAASWLFPNYENSLWRCLAATLLGVGLYLPALWGLAKRHGILETLSKKLQWRAPNAPEIGGMR